MSKLKWSLLPFETSDPAWFSQLCSTAVATIGIASSYSKGREISVGTSLVCAGVLSLGSRKAISCPKFASFVIKTNLLVTCFFAQNFLDYKSARTFVLTGLSLGVMMKPLQIYMSLPPEEEDETKTEHANNTSMIMEDIHDTDDQECDERRSHGDTGDDEVVQFILKEVNDRGNDDANENCEPVDIVINVMPSSPGEYNTQEMGYLEVE